MPYINESLRDHLTPGAVEKPQTPGQLNFQVACVVDDYLAESGVSYTSLNDVIGVLECLKLEVYRRIAAPYEDDKIVDNGDVFTSRLYPTDRS